MPSVVQIEADIAACKDRTLRERMFRKLQIVMTLGDSGTFAMPAWVWRLGGAIIVAHPNEAYSCFQQDLRAPLTDFAVGVMNVTGPDPGYINTPEIFKENIYHVWQTPFDKSALEVLTKTCLSHAKKLASIGHENKR